MPFLQNKGNMTGLLFATDYTDFHRKTKICANQCNLWQKKMLYRDSFKITKLEKTC